MKIIEARTRSALKRLLSSNILTIKRRFIIPAFPIIIFNFNTTRWYNSYLIMINPKQLGGTAPHSCVSLLPIESNGSKSASASKNAIKLVSLFSGSKTAKSWIAWRFALLHVQESSIKWHRLINKVNSQPSACLQRISGIWNFDVTVSLQIYGPLSGIFLRIIFYSDKKFLSTIIYMSGNSVPCSLKLHTQKLHSKSSVYFPRRFCDCVWHKAPSHEVFVHEKTSRRITLMNGRR